MSSILGAIRCSLRRKLLTAYLLVILVGVALPFLEARLIAPHLFDEFMATALGPQLAAMEVPWAMPGHMMGGGTSTIGELTALAFNHALDTALTWTALVAVSFAVLVSAFISARIAGPVLRMARAAQRIAAGHYAEPDRLAEFALARLAPEHAGNGIALESTVGGRLPRVLADEDRAVQVLTNLLSNGLRYTPAGGRVELSAEQQGKMVV